MIIYRPAAVKLVLSHTADWVTTKMIVLKYPNELCSKWPLSKMTVTSCLLSNGLFGHSVHSKNMTKLNVMLNQNYRSSTKMAVIDAQNERCGLPNHRYISKGNWRYRKLSKNTRSIDPDSRLDQVLESKNRFF